MNVLAHPASFRDPSGSLYIQNKRLFRSVRASYAGHYHTLINSGLYATLSSRHLLIAHTERPSKTKDVVKVLEPENIDFISYPYEWTLSEYIDAALTTLEIQKISLAYGMTLKDANAYNIQFHHGRPILIDTLSFKTYEEGSSWIAYKQFCMHFLAPILLMANKDVGLNLLMLSHLDGIPLSLASTLLPKTTYLNISVAVHIHLHAFFQKNLSGKRIPIAAKPMSKASFILLLDTLEHMLRNISPKNSSSHWSAYYNTHAYSPEAFRHKTSFIESHLDESKIKTVLDIGSNTGTFSDLCGKLGKQTIAIDNDHSSVDQHYQRCKKTNTPNCLPLVIDITSPSPSIGWENSERSSFIDRGPFDLVLALALIHHLTIVNNIPFDRAAHLLSKLARQLVIEFVPKHDPQVTRLLMNHNDIFISYTKKHFEKVMSRYFSIRQIVTLKDSDRILYSMQNKHGI